MTMLRSDDDFVPMEVWIPQVCPGCKWYGFPFDEDGPPCESCQMGSKREPGPRELSPNEKRIEELEAKVTALGGKP